MTRPLLLYFSGAGGGAVGQDAGIEQAFPDFDVLAMTYPRWADLAEPRTAMSEVLDRVGRQAEASAKGDRPIVIFGYSLGAQIGLATAHRLADAGRPVALFCALDGKLVSDDRPEKAWLRRALGSLARKIVSRDFRAARTLVASRFSRLLLRLAGDRLHDLARRWRRQGRLPRLLTVNPAFESELTMRLLIAAAVPWMRRFAAEHSPWRRPALLLRIAANAEFDRRWRDLCPEIEIVTIEGEHLTLLQPDQFGRIAESVVGKARACGCFGNPTG